MMNEHKLFGYTRGIGGPTPSKGGHCGHCSALTDKEKRKIDSCPVCGKSMYAYRNRKSKFK